MSKLRTSRARLITRCRWSIASVAIGLSTFVGATETAPLRACVLVHNAPYAMKAEQAQGFDLDTAAAVAQVLHRPLEAVWTNNEPEITEIDDSDFPVRKLVRGQCDAIFSVPGPAADSLGQGDKLALGAAYYGAAFELVKCGGDLPPQVRALRSHAIAIQSQTVAHFALLMVKAQPRTYFSLKTALNGIRQQEAEGGLLWGPTIGWQLHLAASDTGSKDGPQCSFVADYAPPAALRWNQHIATRTADSQLRSDIDRAVAGLNERGALAQIAAHYGMPWHAPFATTYSLGAVNDLARVRQGGTE